MTVERLLQCEFPIPMTGDRDLSSGEAHSYLEWEWLTDQLLTRFVGRSLLRCPVDGCWTDPDTSRRVDDSSRWYKVAVLESHLDSLRELLMDCCDVFHQKMIYLSIAGIVEFIERRKE